MLLPFFLLVSSLFTSAAKADFFIHSWDDHHEAEGVFKLDLEGRFFYSTSNFDPAGNSVSPTGLQNYLRVLTDLTAIYGISSRFSVYARASWVYSRITPVNTAPAAAYGLGDQSLGAGFRVYTSEQPSSRMVPWSVDVQVQADLPTFYNNANADAQALPYLGDGSYDFTIGPFAAIPVLQNKSDALVVEGGGGFTYRTQGFSMDLPWSADVRYVHRKEGLMASVGGYGMMSLRNDSTVNSLTIRTPLGSGGNYITSATNPSFAALSARVGYRFDNGFGFYLAGSYPVWGQAATNGLDVFAGLQARFGDKPRVDSVHLTPQEYGKSNQGFINYSMEAHVLKSNDRLNLIKIDKGSQEGVEVGQVFDIFRVNKDGSTGEAIARGQVTNTKSGEAALKVTEYYKEVWIDEGFIAKRPVQ